MWTDRTKILIGQSGVDKLASCHVAVVGIGGVGGYVCQLLSRAGVGELTLVDFDKVDETNINRQVVADTTTIGQFKTQVMKDMISKINPNCKVNTYNERFCGQFAETLFSKHFDFVVDAIDSVQDKVELICYCKTHNINVISAMGAGNRLEMPNFKVVDIFKTYNDGLSKIMRKKLRERNISSLKVVFSEEITIKNPDTNTIGSISYQPAMCGCVLSGYVINKLLENEK
ncbi:MAG: ThiF family adenylyltransferase [Candidatus Caccovivens sp.]